MTFDIDEITQKKEDEAKVKEMKKRQEEEFGKDESEIAGWDATVEEEQPEAPIFSKESALAIFEEANQIAEELSSCNPIRLKIAHHYGMFHHKILKDSERAVEIVTESVSVAEADIELADEKL